MEPSSRPRARASLRTLGHGTSQNATRRGQGGSAIDDSRASSSGGTRRADGLTAGKSAISFLQGGAARGGNCRPYRPRAAWLQLARDTTDSHNHNAGTCHVVSSSLDITCPSPPRMWLVAERCARKDCGADCCCPGLSSASVGYLLPRAINTGPRNWSSSLSRHRQGSLLAWLV